MSKLFQSMSARNTAQIVRDVFLESELELPGIIYQTAALYVRIGMSDAEIRAAGVTTIVPVRKYTRGQAPGITSKEALHADTDKELDKWIFPPRELTRDGQRKLMGAVLEIAIRALLGKFNVQLSRVILSAKRRRAYGQETDHGHLPRCHGQLWEEPPRDPVRC